MKPSYRKAIADSVTAWINSDERPWYRVVTAERKILPDLEVEQIRGTVVTVFLGESSAQQRVRGRTEESIAIDGTIDVHIAIQKSVSQGGDVEGQVDELMALVELIQDTIIVGDRQFSDGWTLLEIDADSTGRPPFQLQRMRELGQFLDVIPLRFER